MSSKLTSFKIFIASPGGLEDERKAFRNVIAAYNKAEANHREAHFIPVGWEETLRGHDRPQTIINEEVRQCDFFVLLLWDRWGTPTGSTNEYNSSGTQEEYEVALECYRNPKRVMRQIIVFFKAVTPRQLSDPGPQLSRVLEFKMKFEKEKKPFFDTFDDKSVFEERLRQHLGRWLLDHEQGQTGKVKLSAFLPAQSQSPVPEDFVEMNSQKHPEPEKENILTNKAIALAKTGNLTEAEALFTQAISRADDLYAFSAYGEFLVDQQRWVQAERVFRDLIKVAAGSNDQLVAHAYGKLSAICLVLKNLGAAIDSSHSAIAIYEKLSDLPKLGTATQRLGYLYFKNKEYASAITCSLKAQGLFVDAEKWREAGEATAILASATKSLEGKKAAIAILDKEIEFYEKGKHIGMAKDARLRRDSWMGKLPKKKQMKKKKQKNKKKK